MPFIVLLFAGLLASASLAEDEAATRQQLKDLSQQLHSLKKQLGSTQKERSRAARELREVEVEIGKIAAKLHSTRAERDRRQSKLTALQGEQQTLRQRQSQQKALIAEQIRNAYTLGQERQIKMLLNQEDPQSLSRLITYYDYFNAARSQQLDSYRETLTALNALIPEISAQTEALSATERQLAQQRQQLEVQQQRRQRSVAKLDQELKQQQSSIGSLDKQRKSLESILSAIEREITDIAIPSSYRPFKQMRGAMPWPVAGKRLNRYGAPRQGSAVRWQGVQIAGEEGSPVRTIHNGRVVYADWLRGAGLLIIVDHGNDYMSLYAHNQSLLRQEGDWVRGGEAIATLGNSGGQRRSGLYFEIRHKGRPTDPARWCR